ncbi:MAG: DUF3667 domain-containing protein [Ferruginibacter sp.]
MSHLNERKENNCLNCNAVIHGKYCHICGQENLEPAESAWHLVTHFFNDITHFDGKFFSTLKLLIFKPGFLSTEYKLGRRSSYLNPVRMYVFTSAIFFFVFFSINHFELDSSNVKFNGRQMSEINKMDSAKFSQFTKEIKGKPMSRDEFSKYVDTISKKPGFSFAPGNYKSKAEYDSLLKAGVKKHNWLERTLVYKQIEIREKYKNDGRKVLSVFLGILVHSFPQMLFISLPLFALILKLLYIRRKDFYYTNHAIFSIHLYVFIFIFFLIIMGLSSVKNYLHWNWINILLVIGTIYLFYYEYKAMRNFYMQRRAKTILKYIILNTLLLFLMILLFAVFAFFSIFKI